MKEENSCWCDYEGGAEADAEAEAEVEAGLWCQKSRYIELLKERHRRRMAQFVAASLLLLLCGVLAVFLTFRVQSPCDCAGDSQTKSDSDSQSSGVAGKLQRPQSAQRLPSAMLTAPNDNFTNGKYLHWQHTLGEAYIDGGFRYSNGSLTVPRKGLYRVFLQALYLINHSDCTDFLGISSSVYVLRQGDGKDRKLLTAVDTLDCKHNVKKSLYTSGIFKLDTNDKLHVTSSHPLLICKNEFQSFFGAQLESDDWSESS